MENNFGLVGQVEKEPPPEMFDDCSTLGWDVLVAPVSKTAHEKFSGGAGETAVGPVSELSGGGNAPHPLAPSLSDVIREGLQRKQVSAENISLYLSKISCLDRYNKGFQALWNFVMERGGDPLSMSLNEVACWILRFAQHQPHQARNAYSGFVLIPGWEQIKFCQEIKMAKRCWGISSVRYADFWDAKAVLEKLQGIPLKWNDVQQVRDRCIIVLRLFHLCRSIDLARAFRAQSKLSDKQYWLLRRKGAKKPGWEALLSLPIPTVSPVHLLNKYVALTASQGKVGGPVFLAVTPPFAPLTANSIGRITKNILMKLGIPVNIFVAHSTRGAAVKMYKVWV